MTTTRKLLPLIGFHGCEKSTAEAVLSGEAHIKPSENAYDWLGTGVYFWVDSYSRAWDWALSKAHIKDPYVIGAFIDPGSCLNLTDYSAAAQIQQAYSLLVEIFRSADQPMPKNTAILDGVKMARHLDCAVINYMHTLREEGNDLPYDTVYGVFEEGEPLFPDSALKEKTHIQIAVRNTAVIQGYFRPRELCAY